VTFAGSEVVTLTLTDACCPPVDRCCDTAPVNIGSSVHHCQNAAVDPVCPQNTPIVFN